MHWRDVFGKPSTHEAISELIKANISSFTVGLYKDSLLSQTHLAEFSEKINATNVRDISEVKNLIDFQYEVPHFNRPVPILKLFKNVTDRNRFIEFRLIVLQLNLFRNHWAHNVQHDETGWNYQLSSLILRLLEVDISNKLPAAKIEKLRATAYGLLQKNQLEDPHITQQLNRELDEGALETEPRWVSVIKGELSNLTSQMAQQRLVLTGFINSSTSGKEIGHDTEDVETEFVEQVGITFEVASQRLLKIKNIIQYENEEKVDWPGPSSNILNSGVIEEIRIFKPIDKESFTHLPQIKDIENAHSKYYELQMNDWWLKVEEVLKEISWKNEQTK